MCLLPWNDGDNTTAAQPRQMERRVEWRRKKKLIWKTSIYLLIIRLIYNKLLNWFFSVNNFPLPTSTTTSTTPRDEREIEKEESEEGTTSPACGWEEKKHDDFDIKKKRLYGWTEVNLLTIHLISTNSIYQHTNNNSCCWGSSGKERKLIELHLFFIHLERKKKINFLPQPKSMPISITPSEKKKKFNILRERREKRANNLLHALPKLIKIIQFSHTIYTLLYCMERRRKKREKNRNIQQRTETIKYSISC